jgi:hypothetical protein
MIKRKEIHVETKMWLVALFIFVAAICVGYTAISFLIHQTNPAEECNNHDDSCELNIQARP